MDHIEKHGLNLSRISLGTWAIGGWMWGGTDEKESIRTIKTAVKKGVTVIDTAPAYGFGTSERIVGKALKELDRDQVIVSTKVGLDWEDGKPFRNSSPERIDKEIVDSLERLGVDHIDIYYVHWPDPIADFRETATKMKDLYDEGKIRAIGLSNHSVEQMERFKTEAPIHFCQPPYNLFERSIEDDILGYCKENGIGLMTYGALCRELLSGKMNRNREFHGDDLRKSDPKFKQPRFDQYLDTAGKLEDLSENRYGKGILEFSVRWLLDRGVDVPIWGARSPDQLDPVDRIWDFELDEDTMRDLDEILEETLEDPVGPGFMAPPTRKD